jgi:hypothetical protein
VVVEGNDWVFKVENTRTKDIMNAVGIYPKRIILYAAAGIAS